jgi:hypothetical protein
MGLGMGQYFKYITLKSYYFKFLINLFSSKIMIEKKRGYPGVEAGSHLPQPIIGFLKKHPIPHPL